MSGKVNVIEMKVNVKQPKDGKFRVTGSKALSVYHYDITPPTTLRRLIKAHDKLVVHFDLIAVMKRVQDVGAMKD